MLKLRRLARFYSTPYINPVKASPDMHKPVSVEIWEESLSATGKKVPYIEPGMVDHPLYTPPAESATGFVDGLPSPLTWPEFDQMREQQDIGAGKYGAAYFKAKQYDCDATSTIGDYPRIPMQYATLRDPYSYWDMQGRRNYGEVVYDHDEMTDVWGIGPEMDARGPIRSWLTMAAYTLGVLGLVWLWDPQSKAPWAEREFPFDNLKEERGL